MTHSEPVLGVPLDVPGGMVSTCLLHDVLRDVHEPVVPEVLLIEPGVHDVHFSVRAVIVGVTAGAHVENFGVTLTAQAGIKSYETQPADVFAGIGGGEHGTNDTLSANRVQPSTLPVSQTVAYFR